MGLYLVKISDRQKIKNMVFVNYKSVVDAVGVLTTKRKQVNNM